MHPILSLSRPDDWHLHFREQAFWERSIPPTAQHFSRDLEHLSTHCAVDVIAHAFDYIATFITLIEQPETMATYLLFELAKYVPFVAGSTLNWSIDV